MPENSQIISAIGATDALVVGVAAPVSMAVAYLAGGYAIGQVMQNAVSHQSNMQSLATASNAVTIGLILKTGASGA